VSEKSLRNGANHGLLVLAKALPGASGSLALERMQKRSPADANGGIVVHSRKAKWKFRFIGPKVAYLKNSRSISPPEEELRETVDSID
jgi:hypothetical protein